MTDRSSCSRLAHENVPPRSIATSIVVLILGTIVRKPGKCIIHLERLCGSRLWCAARPCSCCECGCTGTPEWPDLHAPESRHAIGWARSPHVTSRRNRWRAEWGRRPPVAARRGFSDSMKMTSDPSGNRLTISTSSRMTVRPGKRENQYTKFAIWLMYPLRWHHT